MNIVLMQHFFSIGDENFQEIVASIIKNDTTMTEEALYLMKRNAGIQYAAQFVKLHEIEHKWVSSDVLTQLKNLSNTSVAVADESWEDLENDVSVKTNPKGM
jgi:hypothetical protein